MKLSWFHYIHGDYTNPQKPVIGLINQLSKRVGMLAKISNLMPSKKLKILVNGLFISKLSYCLGLFGGIWGLDTMQIGDTRHNSFTKASLRALQTLLNKVMRLLTKKGYDTPILTLLEETEMLSVHQLIAYSTIVTTFKIRKSKEPLYLANRLGFTEGEEIGHFHRRQHEIPIDFKLETAQ